MGGVAGAGVGGTTRGLAVCPRGGAISVAYTPGWRIRLACGRTSAGVAAGVWATYPPSGAGRTALGTSARRRAERPQSVVVVERREVELRLEVVFASPGVWERRLHPVVLPLLEEQGGRRDPR